MCQYSPICKRLLVPFKAALSISNLNKNVIEVWKYFFDISANSLKLKDSQITVNSLKQCSTMAVMQSMGEKKYHGSDCEDNFHFFSPRENSLCGRGGMFCLLKITGTLSVFHLSNRLEAASRSLVLHPPRVLRLSCLGLATDCTFI